MPGSSLWLTPPPSHPLHAVLTTLITATLPAQHLPPSAPRVPFSPHLTLTSNIDPSTYGADPQAWLDSIPFPSSPPARVVFEGVRTEDFFFRRCYIKCAFDGVRDVAAMARARGVEGKESVGERTARWLEEWRVAFGPHVSLVYGDVPIDEAELQRVAKTVQEAGIALGEVPGSSGGCAGWEGGVVWLVPTDRNIEQWKPIATRTL